MQMSAYNKLFFGLVLIFLAAPSGAFRCYIGSSDDPDNIYTVFYVDEIEPSNRCVRYHKPTCSGCILNATDYPAYDRRCWAGCDDESIKNATWTWFYDSMSAGVCSDIRTNFQQYTYYRDVVCCRTDLCNAPNSAIGNRASSLIIFLSLLVLWLV